MNYYYFFNAFTFLVKMSDKKKCLNNQSINNNLLIKHYNYLSMNLIIYRYQQFFRSRTIIHKIGAYFILIFNTYK